jgi:SAM-dependent methyltransferase
MQKFVAEHLSDRRGQHLRVLDVGGANVNGSYRDFFDDPQWHYASLDALPGEGVDIVPADPWAWNEVPADHYDVVVSGQAFEHIAFPWVTIQEVCRILKPGGLLCMVAPSSGEEHRYSLDCWRYYRDGLVALAMWGDLEVVEARVHGEDEEWDDDSVKWRDAVLVARKPVLGGVLPRLRVPLKRWAVRRLTGVQARRRGAQVQAEADRIFAR